MAPTITYPSELVALALLRYIRGCPQRSIADGVGVPRGTIRSWIESFDGGRLGKGVGDHSHHWIIDEPNGPVSSGLCKICFDRRDFRNSSEESGWRNTLVASGRRYF